MGSAAINVLPLGNAYWQSLGWWDFKLLTGMNGSAQSANIPSRAGANVIVPASQIINDVAEYGNRGLNVVNQSLTCNALAAQLSGAGNQDCTVVQVLRAQVVQEVEIWSARAAGGNYLGGRLINERACLQKTSTGGGTVTATGTADLGYDDHILIWTYQASTATWTQYVDGVVDPLSNQLDVQPITVNLFGMFAFTPATLENQLFAMSPNYSTPARVAQIYTYLVSQNYVLPQNDPRVPKILTCGASIMQGQTNEIDGAGYRGVSASTSIAQMIIDNRWSFTTTGSPFGICPLRNTESTSGQDATAITIQCTANVDARTGLVLMDLGNQELNATGAVAATVLNTIAAALHTSRVALYAVNPNAGFVVNTLPPYSDPTKNAVLQQVNAGLPAVWNASDAQFPSNPTLFRDLAGAAFGPTWMLSLFAGAGNDHPNAAGYAVYGAAAMAAQNATGQTLPQFMKAISPT